MGHRKLYAPQRKARRATRLGTAKTPSVSIQALRDEQQPESGMTRDSALVQSGSLLEKVWGTSATSPIQAKAAQQQELRYPSGNDNYGSLHVQKQSSAESNQSPTAWMRRPLPALSAPLQMQKQPLSAQLKGEEVNTPAGIAREGENQPTLIQRLRLNPKDNHYYSEASTVLEDSDYKATDFNSAFITATSFGGMGGGHTTLFLEYFTRSSSKNGIQQYAPINYRIELGLDTNDDGEQVIDIDVVRISSGRMMAMTGARGLGNKKTWRISRANAKAAKDKATQIQGTQDSMSYSEKLTSLQANYLKQINCSYFGEQVLKAAGVNADSFFAGFSMPSALTNPKKENNAIKNVHSIKEIAERYESTLPEHCQTQSAFVEATQYRPESDKSEHEEGDGDENMALAGKQLERYHIYYPEITVRADCLHYAMSLIEDYLTDSETAFQSNSRVRSLVLHIIPRLISEGLRLRAMLTVGYASDETKASQAVDWLADTSLGNKFARSIKEKSDSLEDWKNDAIQEGALDEDVQGSNLDADANAEPIDSNPVADDLENTHSQQNDNADNDELDLEEDWVDGLIDSFDD